MAFRTALVVAFLVAGSVVADDVLRVGVAFTDVTPPVGYRRAGNYSELISDGVADPLFAKALYFQQGEREFVLCVCDQTGLEREPSDLARRIAAKEARIPEHCIVLSATHTHGGALFNDPILGKLFHERALARDGKDPSYFPDYPKEFAEKCARAIVEAKKNARPATIEATTTRVPNIAFNRRFLMKDGSVRFNPGKLNRNIVRPAGAASDWYPILLVRDAGTNKPFASLSVFSMHVAVFGGPKFGADFPGHLQTHLQRKFGKEFVSVFGEGTAGDQNHINVGRKESDPTPEQFGAIFAERFLAAIPDMKKVEPSLKATVGTVKMPLLADRPKDLVTCTDRLVGEKSRKNDFLDQVDAYRVLMVHHLRTLYGDHITSEVHAVRIGKDAAIVTLPHEIFLGLGMQIRVASPFRHTLILSLARDVDFYVPTKDAYGEGSYEVVNSPVQPGSGELLVEEAIRQLKALAK